MKMKSMFNIDGYLAVISHIQNVYPPEKDKVGWMFGFKYKSGIYEFFTFKTLQEARNEYNRLAKTIEDFYGGCGFVMDKIPDLSYNPTQKEMLQLAMSSIKQNKKGKYRLSYDKERRTIVAVER